MSSEDTSPTPVSIAGTETTATANVDIGVHPPTDSMGRTPQVCEECPHREVLCDFCPVKIQPPSKRVKNEKRNGRFLWVAVFVFALGLASALGLIVFQQTEIDSVLNQHTSELSVISGLPAADSLILTEVGYLNHNIAAVCVATPAAQCEPLPSFSK